MNFDTFSVQYLPVMRFVVLIVCDTERPDHRRAFSVPNPVAIFMRKDGQMTIRAKRKQDTRTFSLNGRTILGVQAGAVVETLTAPDLSTHEGRVEYLRNDAHTQELAANQRRVSAIIDFRKNVLGPDHVNGLKEAKEAFDDAFPNYVTPRPTRDVRKRYDDPYYCCYDCNGY